MHYATRFVRLAAILMITVASAAPLAAQTWVRTYSMEPSPGVQEYPTSIMQTSDGSFLVSGMNGPPGSAWVAKLDPFGDVQWSQAITGWGILPQAIETLDGGFALANAISIRGADLCWDVRFDLAKLNSTGAIAWHKQYGPDAVWTGSGCDGGQANPRAIIQAPDGSFLISGVIETGVAPFSRDLWLLKVDSDGNLLWQKSYGGAGRTEDFAPLLGLLPGGGIVIAGHGRIFSAGLDDVWVLWLDSNGDIVQQRAFGGTQDENPFSLTVTDTGEVIVASHSWSFPPGGGHYGAALWILKLGTTGDIVWQKSYSPSIYPAFYPRLTELPNGNLVVLSTQSISSIARNPSALMELSPEGDIIWAKGRYPHSTFVYAVTTIAGGGLVTASMGDSPFDYLTLVRTDAFGGIDDSCPITDDIGFAVDTAATITPSNAVAVPTTYPTVDITPAFWVPTWEITDQCITLAPQIDVSPSPVDFGSVPVGITATQTVTVSNTGKANLLISTMTVGAPFVLSSSCAGFNLIPGTSCDGTIEFTPGATGAVAAILAIGSSDPINPLLEVPVTAFAFDPAFIFSDDFESGDFTAWGGVGS